MLQKIHHIDFVVRDLGSAVAAYRRLFGVEPLPRERLDGRGVELVRFQLGETWLILVQPVRQDSPVMEFLERHGEGFFHIAYQVASVDEAARELDGRGVRRHEIRRGVEGWKLLDLETAETCGVMTQLVEQDGGRADA